jgi:hypothetical protein
MIDPAKVSDLLQPFDARRMRVYGQFHREQDGK